MTEQEIKQRVDSVFDETGLVSIPVEVVLMVNFYGFEVYELEMDDNTSGMIVVDENNINHFDTNKIIVVNSNHSNVRKRFTIAHELGHFILNDKPSKCFAHRDSSDVYNQEERDANSFASALLMPEDDINRFIHSLIGDSNTEQNEFLLIQEVAKRYNVSESAAEVRLKKLNKV